MPRTRINYLLAGEKIKIAKIRGPTTTKKKQRKSMQIVAIFVIAIPIFITIYKNFFSTVHYIIISYYYTLKGVFSTLFFCSFVLSSRFLFLFIILIWIFCIVLLLSNIILRAPGFFRFFFVHTQNIIYFY